MNWLWLLKMLVVWADVTKIYCSREMMTRYVLALVLSWQKWLNWETARSFEKDDVDRYLTSVTSPQQETLFEKR